jgi:hypothetical protein
MRFVRAADVGNFNGDMHNGIPCADLVIGAALRDAPGAADAGAFYIHYGGANGANIRVLQSDIPGEDVVAGDQFGLSMSALPNGTLTDDLIVGAPGEDGFGAVFLFKGAPSGLAIATPTKWTQETAFIPETSAAGDSWGYSVAGLGNGAVAIGAPFKTVGAGTHTGGVWVVKYQYVSPSFNTTAGFAYHQANFTTAPPPLNTNVVNAVLRVELLQPRAGR